MYQLPPEIAAKYDISLKTVYNYLEKYPSQIRIKKEHGKRFVNSEDFEKVYLQNVQNVQSVSSAINPANSNTQGNSNGFGSGAQPVETFVTHVTKELQNRDAQEADPRSSIVLGSDFETVQKLQNELEAIQGQQHDLMKRNDVLEQHAAKFSIMAIEERNEKKEWISKYDALQKTHQQAQENFFARSLQAGKRQSFLIALCAMLALAVSISLWLLFQS